MSSKMPVSEDLIDFEIIENQKENIKSLPGGRSARALADVFSPLKKITTPCDTKCHNDLVRQEYESELASMSESDDPLDIYDRYIRWTLDAYPSAQATASSKLLPLLERATKAFINSAQYKNDPRYLKIWIMYIKTVSDAPREVFAFLARHGIGEYLALYYEEFAAWLECAGRWRQADEIYHLGIDKEARPTARLLRKFDEFQARSAKKLVDLNQPSSPALPTVRPVLMAKIDPFAPAIARDPQAPVPNPGLKPSVKNAKQKLQIFSDNDNNEASTISHNETAGWQSISSLAERKKENTLEPKPWAGETLKAGGQGKSHTKIQVYKDMSQSQYNYPQITDPGQHQITINQKGKKESIFVNLEALYPTPEIFGSELSIEELRAKHRGYMSKSWEPEDSSRMVVIESSKPTERICKNNSLDDELNEIAVENLIISGPIAKETCRERRARKMKIREINETQIIKAKLSSPTGPKIMKRKSKEQTMTIHTKAATDDIYDLFNQPLQNIDKVDVADEDSFDDDDDDDDGTTDGDYTSGGESTGTGRLQIAGEEEDIDETSDLKSASEWTELSFKGHLPDLENQIKSKRETLLADQKKNKLSELQPKTPISHESLTMIEPTSLQTSSPAHEQPSKSYRDFTYIPQNRLPFMTPIAEQTESSIGVATIVPEEKHHLMTKLSTTETSSKITKYSEDSREYDVEVTGLQNSKIENYIHHSPFNTHYTSNGLIIKARISDDKTNFASKITIKREIIKDKQCNPRSQVLHTSILALVQPPINAYDGFFDYSNETGAKTSEIRKYIKATSKSQRKGSEKTLSVQASPVLQLPGAHRQYIIKRELGAGTFAPVYLIESKLLVGQEKTEHNEVEQLEQDGACPNGRRALEALKMDHVASAWEFYILRQARYRLGNSRTAQSIIKAHEMHLYKNESFLIEEFREQGTLLDIINISKEDKSGSGAMDETLAMFFSVELFRTIEELHVNGILHGDLKADNCLVRLDSIENSETWGSSYRKDGTQGWHRKGICLIDFGCGIDMYVFNPQVQFIADWETSPEDCAEAREMRPWTYQIDYHGLAGIIHSMLFGKYIEIVADNRNDVGPGAKKIWRLRENLKRYWQTDIWAEAFDLLLNASFRAKDEGDGNMPLTHCLSACRKKMELYLEAKSDRSNGLQASIQKLESILSRKK
ncbi:putative protein kinase [Erysiphe neolycopersici]|uniref:Checkpoint serine/threonine-protein kinase BUB1 n=1 Tax=Erysiphe neolycopersici TaxID=212602 RepID=A0A420I4I2_9PEZI|nr:putative protein kinase [Erysiphe neolycopersici]